MKDAERTRPETVEEHYLTASEILRYLIGSDDRLDTMVLCNPQHFALFTTDKDVYHALASVKEYDNFKLNRLAKLFEVVAIHAAEKKEILRDSDVEKLRKQALSKDSPQ